MSWIPVKYRLPKMLIPESPLDDLPKTDMVLVYGDIGIRIAEFHFEYRVWHDGDDEFWRFELVTHWQPLPEPPY